MSCLECPCLFTVNFFIVIKLEMLLDLHIFADIEQVLLGEVVCLGVLFPVSFLQVKVKGFILVLDSFPCRGKCLYDL